MIVGLVIGLIVGRRGAWLVLRAQYAADGPRRALLGRRSDAPQALATNNQSFVDLAKSQLEQLQQRTTQELEQRKQAVEHLVTPITESLQKVDGKLQQLEVARTTARTPPVERPGSPARREAERCAARPGTSCSALRDRPNVRGRWGEIQLRRVVEMAGMLEHCDFETQAHVATDGQPSPPRPRREARPARRRVVVDAKFAGQAYLESLSAGRRGASRKAARPRAPRSRPHREAVREELLGAVRRDARVRRACSSRARRS